MADTYIDYDEMKIYSDHTISALSALGAVALQVEVLKLALQAKNERVQSLRVDQRGVKAGGDDQRSGRNAQQQRVVKALRSLKSHLDGINNDEDAPDLDLADFFEGGKLGDLSNASAAHVSLKAKYAVSGLEKSKDFSQRKEKQEKLQALILELDHSLGATSGVSPEEANASAALKKAGEEWRREYRGLKWIVWGALLQTNRESEFSAYFKDELVGGRPKKTEDEPAVSTQPS